MRDLLSAIGNDEQSVRDKTMIDKLSEFEKIHPSRRSVKAVLLAGGKVLLLEKPNGRWDLPGGKVDPGETLFEGLRREILEEAGIKIDAAKFIAGWDKNTTGDEHNMVALYLASLDCKPQRSNIRLSNEHVTGDFFSFKNAAKLELPRRYCQALELAQSHISS